MSNTLKQLRGKKATGEQLEILVELIQSNRIIITGKCHPNDMTELDVKWNLLVEMLNGVKNGAKKDMKQWKNFFASWKSKTRKKARQNKKSMQQTGGGGYYCKDLSEIENRLMRVVGWISIVGNEDLPEEIDPDCDLPSGDCVPQPTNNNNNNLIIFEEVTLLDVGEVCEDDLINPITVVPDTKQHSVKLGPRKKINSRRKVPQQNQLEASAKMYAESVADLSRAVSKIADSISQLATSISEMAVAMTQNK